MSKSTYPLKLPLSIKKAAQRLAKEDGVSSDQWIAVGVAEKVGVVEPRPTFSRNEQARPLEVSTLRARRSMRARSL